MKKITGKLTIKGIEDLLKKHNDLLRLNELLSKKSCGGAEASWSSIGYTESVAKGLDKVERERGEKYVEGIKMVRDALKKELESKIILDDGK